MDFVHLHIHSEYSILDGSIKIKKLVKELAKQGAKAAALTDHDGMHGTLEFYLACQAEKINGIIGHEINVEPVFIENKKETCHLILLAQNEIGYKNLIHLCTLANTTYKNHLFTDSTCVPFEELKKHGAGLFCLTSCLHGELARLLIKNKEEEARDYLNQLAGIFGRENVFVELIDNGLRDQKIIIPKLVELAKQCHVEIVATADAHYLKKSDRDTHFSLLAIKHKLRQSDVKNVAEDIHFDLKPVDEMITKFAQYPEAIANSLKIAEKCQLKIDTKSIFMPNYSEKEGESANDCLIRLSRTGLQNRKRSIQFWMKDKFTEEVWSEYEKRLEYELSVIINMNFSGYFLIVQDFINWAKNKNIPVGPGRGSAAGSLVTYVLNITNIDPLRFNLLFERFLNPERISMPDIDTDFCQEKRADVLHYVYQKYGARAVSQIVTFGRMMARNALKNLARINGWAFHESNDFAKLIPETPGITLEQALEAEPKLKERLDSDERAKQLWDGSLEIEGTLSSLGIHAAGVIISDRALDERCPLLESEGQLLTQFEHKYSEKIGLIKFDFLGLKTLTVIQKTVDLIRKHHGITIELDNINLDDKSVYQMISTAHVTGLFQLESTGMRKLISDLKPTCFTDIIAVLALFRPGPLGSGMVEDFVKRKHGQTEVVYPFKELEDILQDTYGVIVYQEQVQKIAAVLASYSLGEADLLRRAMGKKDKNEMERQKSRFVSGAASNGHNTQKSAELFDLMAKFAEYGFNKSHTAAYGWVTYQTAWLKAYYTAEFMTAIMSCDLDNTDKIVTYIRDCVRMKFKILPPCVNHSHYEFSIPAKKTIQFGLGAIKGLGSGVIEHIVKERNQNGPYTSVPEFISRVDARKINKKVMESLIKAGAFDSIHPNRRELFTNFDNWLKTIARELERSEQSVLGIFDSVGQASQKQKIENTLKGVQLKKTHDWTFHEKLSFEHGAVGFYMTGHPSDIYKDDFPHIREFSLAEIAKHVEPENIPDFKRKVVKVAGIVTAIYEKLNKENLPYIVFKLEDGEGELELTLFHKQFQALSSPIKTGQSLCVDCKIKKGIEEGSVRGVVQAIYPLAQKRMERIKKVTLYLKENILTEMENTEKIKKLASTYKGKIPLFVNVTFPNEKLCAKAKLADYSINPTDEFILAFENAWPGEIKVRRNYELH